MELRYSCCSCEWLLKEMTVKSMCFPGKCWAAVLTTEATDSTRSLRCWTPSISFNPSAEDEIRDARWCSTLCLASRAGVYRLVAPPDGTTAVSPQSLIRVMIVHLNNQLHLRCVVTHLNAQWATTWFHWKANSMTDLCHFIPTHQFWSVNLQPFLPGNRPSTFIRHKPVRKSIKVFLLLFVLLSQLLHQQTVSGTDLM